MVLNLTNQTQSCLLQFARLGRVASVVLCLISMSEVLSMAEETKVAVAAGVNEVVKKPLTSETSPATSLEEEVKEVEVTEREDEEEKGEDETPEKKDGLTLEVPENVVADLVDPEKKALRELQALITAAISKNEFFTTTTTNRNSKDPNGSETKELEEEASTSSINVVVDVDEDDDGAKTVEAIEETVVSTTSIVTKESQNDILIWGVPLINGADKSDTILIKFLRARDLMPKDAFTMIKNTIKWREEFGIEKLLEEEDASAADDDTLRRIEKKVVFMHGRGKEGHPVCYNVYGEFQDKEMYKMAFGDEEKRRTFLRWRVKVLEKGIRENLDFGEGGICTMVQVMDLTNTPGPGKKELRLATKQALDLLQDNYPEFVDKQVFINVPWWYLAFSKMISPFLTQRTKSKFIFAGRGKSSETLFRYIAPEQVPVQYGGLSTENDTEFGLSDAANVIEIKPTSKHCIEIPVSDVCLVLWELRVLGWEVSYGAEFVPNVEGGYAVIIQKMQKIVASDEPILKSSFRIDEPGKIVISLKNTTSKKKKLLYRYKMKTSST